MKDFLLIQMIKKIVKLLLVIQIVTQKKNVTNYSILF